MPRCGLYPLTTLSGDEVDPTFSPDGEQLAFSWNGDHEDNFDIYVKLVGSPDVRRLTSDPFDDGSPSWSPDGKQIAFVRCKPNETGCRIYLTSPIGGTDLKLSDFPVDGRIEWSPDGRSIVAGRAGAEESASTRQDDPGIYLVPLSGGNPTRLTQARLSVIHTSPAFSPDGRHLAYVVRGVAEMSDVAILDWTIVWLQRPRLDD